jgi:hypothetical protein
MVCAGCVHLPSRYLRLRRMIMIAVATTARGTARYGVSVLCVAAAASTTAAMIHLHLISMDRDRMGPTDVPVAGRPAAIRAASGWASRHRPRAIATG